jgi:hypothetical protein
MEQIVWDKGLQDVVIASGIDDIPLSKLISINGIKKVSGIVQSSHWNIGTFVSQFCNFTSTLRNFLSA